jgi:peptidoglycan/xylan/chitin deacetylase (PgdA/CDA1 family)
LLSLLSKHQVKATFFVSGKRAAQYPELMNEIIRSGHTVGNHTFSHDHLIMLKGKNALKKEIGSAQNVLALYGIRTFVFRPPAGITNPILGGVLEAFGLHCINFRCRAFDAGNRRIRNLSKKILHKVLPGDIILLHDTIPTEKTDQTLFNWLNEIEQLLIGLKKKEISVLPLSDIIRIPVMESIENRNGHF